MGFAKKAWNTLTTGWVVEYPNAERDFFDNRDRKVYTGQPQKRREQGRVETVAERDFAAEMWNKGRERSVSEESNADACLRWSEQMKRKKSQEGGS